jgi:iron(III) transport system ATP-binding protein
MARAVVYRPDVLLLDEPLSNLDVKLRVAMRAELKRLQQTLGVTTLFVTHDQHEALALSDRVAVMREGQIEQVGTPEAIYQHPLSPFVADFVGATNLIDGVVHGAGVEPETLVVGVGEQSMLIVRHAQRLPVGASVRIAVKPERLIVSAAAVTGPDQSLDRLIGEIESVAYLGSFYSYVVTVGSQRMEVRCGDAVVADGKPAGAGTIVWLRVDRDSTRIFEA